jgi:transcriptional regulator with XRE-family HTH domain
MLYTNEEKLEYIIKVLKLKPSEISKKLGISPSMLSQIQNYSVGKLKPYHLYAISKAYDIPMEIFQNEDINTQELINALLIYQEDKVQLFDKNDALLEKILGKWYLYSYPSNPNYAKVYATEHHIHSDGTVIDEHNNRGKIYFGKNQSLIVKESNNCKNLTTITFDNNRVTYEYFIFSRVSKSINLNRELFNFGFFSREKLSEEEATMILGERSKVQIQMDYGMLERLSLKIKV